MPSIWKRLSQPKAEPYQFLTAEELTPEEPEVIPEPEAGEPVEEEAILPRYTDIDINQHVNNTKYLDWCCNALGIEAMKEMCLCHIVLNYNAEVRPGQAVQAQLRRLGNDFSYCGFVDGTRHFDVGGTLRKRAASKKC